MDLSILRQRGFRGCCFAGAGVGPSPKRPSLGPDRQPLRTPEGDAGGARPEYGCERPDVGGEGVDFSVSHFCVTYERHYGSDIDTVAIIVDPGSVLDGGGGFGSQSGAL